MSRPIDVFDNLRADAGVSAISELRAKGSTTSLSDEQRTQMLADSRAGKVVQIEFDALTYIQRETPNRNYVRFKPSILRKLARSFIGQPFLKDHDKYDISSRGGTILASELVSLKDGEQAFKMTILAVKAWAVEGVLDGTIDRFSIGWERNGGDVLCTACGKSLMSRDCSHYLGDKFEAKDGSEKFVEGVFQDAVGTEASGVSVPAVVGTEVMDGIRAALAAHREGGPAPQKEAPKMDHFKKLALALGLSEETDPGTLVAAVLGKLGATDKALVQANTDLSLARTQLAAYEAERIQTAGATLIERAIADGLIVPQLSDSGVRLETPLETAIKGMVQQLGLAAAESYVKSLPKVAPVGSLSATQTQTGAADDRTKDRPLAITPQQLKIAKQLGLTPEQYLKGQERLRSQGFNV